MKEQLLDKLKDPKVKNNIIETTKELLKETWVVFKGIDRDNISELPYPYIRGCCRMPFHYLAEEFVSEIIEQDDGGGVFIGLPLIDKTEDSLFEMASRKIEFKKRLSSKVQDILLKEVLDKFDQPHIVTVEEMCQVYGSLIVPTISFSQMNLEELYILFVEKIRHSLLGLYHSKFFEIGCTTPVTVCVVFYQDGKPVLQQDASFPPIKHKDEIDLPTESSLWNKNGIVIRAVPTENTDDQLFQKEFADIYGSAMDIKIELCGCMATNVFESMGDNLDTLLKTVKKSYALMLYGGSSFYYIGLPYEDYLSFIDKVKAYVGALFNISDKKDTINRRIRNSVSLLIESDAQSNKAISISLSIAAIEALLGEKGAEISEKLSTNIAVLLEPDLNKRTAAEKFFKDLYNMRSRTLHGESLEDEEQLSEKARHLAAAVLDAVITLRDFLVKSGFSPKNPQDLLRELKASKYRSGNVICDIKDYIVRNFWDDINKS